MEIALSSTTSRHRVSCRSGAPQEFGHPWRLWARTVLSCVLGPEPEMAPATRALGLITRQIFGPEREAFAGSR